MIEQAVEDRLRTTFVEARQKRYMFVTVEQVLMALTDVPSAKEVLQGCQVNLDRLRSQLGDHITESTPTTEGTEGVDPQPTLGFQRVLQRAMMWVQSQSQGAEKKEVTSAHVLMAIFGEKDSSAVFYLHSNGVTRLDVVTFIQSRSRPQG